MKKNLLKTLPLLLAAIVLTSCSGGDIYSGNYTEVTGDDLTTIIDNYNEDIQHSKEVNVNRKVIEKFFIQSVDEKNEKNNITATYSAESLTSRAKLNTEYIWSYYTKTNMSIDAVSLVGGKGTFLFEKWVINKKDFSNPEESYTNYSIDINSENGNINLSGKVKGNAPANASIYQSLISSLIGQIPASNLTLDSHGAFYSKLQNKNTKVSKCGDNKLKLEFEEDDLKINFYCIKNDSGRLGYKYEIPESTITIDGLKTTVSYVGEYIPVDTIVSAPTDKDSYK